MYLFHKTNGGTKMENEEITEWEIEDIWSQDLENVIEDLLKGE